MKVQVTKKQVMEHYYKIIRLGYCEAQYLLRFYDPQFYTAGVYGWNSDIYIIGSIAICTGYRPFGNISVSYDVLCNYEQEAIKIVSNYDLSYEEHKNKVNGLLHELIEEVIK